MAKMWSWLDRQLEQGTKNPDKLGYSGGYRDALKAAREQLEELAWEEGEDLE